MKTRSKLLSIALSLALAVGLCPAPAFAADNGGGSLKSMSLTTQAASDHTADEAISWVVSKLGKPLDYDGMYGAQCVDLIAYYYSECLGVPVSSGHAYQYATNALPAGWTRTAGGKPQKGDILVWTNNDVGHVAIYESDFVTYHQNWLYQQTVLKETRYRYDNSVFGNYWGCIHPNFKSSGPTPPSDSVNIRTGVYSIAPKHAQGMRLDIQGGSKESGANAYIWTNAATAANYGAPATAQQFAIARSDSGSGYRITAQCSGLSLDLSGGVYAPGANVQQYTPNEWDAQRWTFQDAGGGYYYIRNASGLYLDVDNGKSKDGSNVLGFSFNGADNQKWKLTALTSLSSATVTVPDQTYTGKALTPAPTVKVGSATLAAGTDYTVSYKDNTAVGTATVTVSGKGAYTGTKAATFKIAAPAQTEPADPGKPGEPVEPTTPTDPTEPTTPTDPKTPADPADPARQDPVDDPGQGGQQQAGDVAAKPTSIASATVTGVKSKTYTGKVLVQSPTVKVGGKTLKAGTDYTISYANNVKAGKAAMTITGQGAYTGTKAVTFAIAKANVKNATAAKVKSQKYKKGKAIKPSPKITYKGKTLKKGTDYTLKYKNNKKRGTATITVKGKGNFTGAKAVKFKIK